MVPLELRLDGVDGVDGGGWVGIKGFGRDASPSMIEHAR